MKKKMIKLYMKYQVYIKIGILKRHMINIIRRINRARIVHRVNLNQLKHIYIMKFNDKQTHFEKKKL